MIVALEEYVDLIIKYAHRYLACGGSTSRLEEKLTELGEEVKIRTEVFATSTGVFVTCSPYESVRTITRMSRIKSGDNDLAELVRLEKILNDVKLKEYEYANLENEIVNGSEDNCSKITFLFGILVFGVANSLPVYGSMFAAIASGIIAILVFWMSGAFAKRLGLTGVFTEFLGCSFVFLVSGIMAQQTGIHPKAFAIGAMILMVPGLTITNAISELAEHNFVSGTSKMMRGMLTLMAMGTAFLLVQDLVHVVEDLNLFVESPAQTYPAGFWLRFFGVVGSVTAASILFNVPLRMIPFTLVTSVVSWVFLDMLKDSGFFVLGSFIPALSVGLFSLGFSRILGVPSQVFSVPGILSLVPGMLALSSFFQFSGVQEEQGAIAMRVMVVASSIVFGLFTARIPLIMLRPKSERFFE
jgi:uncharacterized membrane protein YjjP (DUF1212 family)